MIMDLKSMKKIEILSPDATVNWFEIPKSDFVKNNYC